MDIEKPESTEEFNVTFKNGALAKIKTLATDLNISEDRLQDILTKGIRLMELSKEGTFVTFKKGKEEYRIDLRLL